MYMMDETLDEHEQRQINDGLFNIRTLSEMTPETERMLWVWTVPKRLYAAVGTVCAVRPRKEVQ